MKEIHPFFEVSDEANLPAVKGTGHKTATTKTQDCERTYQVLVRRTDVHVLRNESNTENENFEKLSLRGILVCAGLQSDVNNFSLLRSHRTVEPKHGFFAPITTPVYVRGAVHAFVEKSLYDVAVSVEIKTAFVIENDLALAFSTSYGAVAVDAPVAGEKCRQL